MSLVEVSNSNNINIDKNKNYLIVKNKGAYTLIQINEIKEIKAIIDSFMELSNKVNFLETQLKTLINKNLPKIVEEYTNKFDNDNVKNNLVRYMAFELLNDDININGIDFPSNYEEIKKYVFENKGNELIPNGFEKYINKMYQELLVEDEKREV